MIYYAKFAGEFLGFPKLFSTKALHNKLFANVLAEEKQLKELLIGVISLIKLAIL